MEISAPRRKVRRNHTVFMRIESNAKENHMNPKIKDRHHEKSALKTTSRKLIPAILIGAAAGFLLCFGILAWLVHAFFFGAAPAVYEGPEHYDKLLENRIHSGLLLFPDQISPAAKQVDFYYYWRDTFNFPTAQIHLSCTYAPEDYEKEITRIQSVSKQIGQCFQQVYADNGNDFSVPAYVAISGNNIWEYALLLEKSHTIHYIFTEYCSSEDIHFDKNYLPKNFNDTSRLDFGKGFSIYEYPVYENSEITAIEGDYSRDAVVPKTEGHYVDAGNYSLQVATEIDKNGRETITGCTLYYLDGNTEKSWEYSDLNGKIYRDITLNEDRSRASIFWEDGNERKESIFDIRGRKFLPPDI